MCIESYILNCKFYCKLYLSTLEFKKKKKASMRTKLDTRFYQIG